MLKRFLFITILFTISLISEIPTFKNVTRLYIATFNRTPDIDGLNYWVKDSGLSLEGVAQSFFDQPETKDKYPNTSDIDYFIKSVYKNLFNREVDNAGLEYWHNELESGHIKKGKFILAVINGALGEDKIKLSNETYKALEELKLALDMDSYFSKTGGKYYDGGVDNIIVKDIDNAQNSIYMAIYEMTNKDIVLALKNAYDRGIDIKIFTDDSTIKDKAFKDLIDYGIEIRSDSDSYALMHDKFTIIDNHILWSGSGNYTVYSFYRNNENYIRIKDKDIAKIYSNKFFKLFNNNDNEILKPYHKDYTFVYFAPDYDLSDILINKINHASKSIKFMIYAFTDKTIAKALIDAKNRGIEVKGVFDEKQNSYQRYSKYNYLKDNGIDVYLDKNSFKLHDKVMIIDDNSTLTGSYNYTQKASEYNQENLLIIDRDDISLKYKNEFNKIYNKAISN